MNKKELPPGGRMKEDFGDIKPTDSVYDLLCDWHNGKIKPWVALVMAYRLGLKRKEANAK
jgi:hypothetical protein